MWDLFADQKNTEVASTKKHVIMKHKDPWHDFHVEVGVVSNFRSWKVECSTCCKQKQFSYRVRTEYGAVSISCFYILKVGIRGSLVRDHNVFSLWHKSHKSMRSHPAMSAATRSHFLVAAVKCLRVVRNSAQASFTTLVIKICNRCLA